MHKDKVCLICGRVFTPTHNNQKYCSRKCKEERIRQQDREYHIKHRKPIYDIYFDQRTQTKYYVKGYQVIAEDQSGIKIVESCRTETAANKALNRLSMSLGYLPLLCEVQASQINNP